jgi:polar amino acid transport system substrate-binding protein
MLFAETKTIVLGNGEWEPYLGKNLKHGGPSSHIVTEAFKLSGIDVSYEWYGNSWKRAYQIALKGKVNHGTLVWSRKPEREKEMYYSTSIVVPGKKDVFWHLKTKNFDWNTIQDLKGMKIGGTLGYTYGIEFDAAAASGLFRLDNVAEEAINFKKLLKGRVDLVPSGDTVGKEILKNQLTPEEAALITYHEKPFRITGYHLLLTKALPENEELMKKFDKGFKQLQNSGFIDQVYKDMEAGKYK